MDQDRRKLNEVLARYDLEPSLTDVWVEGLFDREVLTHCFRTNGQEQQIFYEIDTVEIPEETVRFHGLTNGNKQRVIVLSRLLSELNPDMRCRCLVDRDLDEWSGSLEQNAVLLWTAHSSIELYFYSEPSLQELLVVAARARFADWPEFLNSLTSLLQDLFAMRLADRELSWAMEWLAPYKLLDNDERSIKFDSNEYIDRLLSKNGKLSKKQEFETCYRTWRGALVGDPRNSIKGHDMVGMLSWSVKAFKGLKELASDAAVERIFVLAAPRIPALLEILA